MFRNKNKSRFQEKKNHNLRNPLRVMHSLITCASLGATAAIGNHSYPNSINSESDILPDNGSMLSSNNKKVGLELEFLFERETEESTQPNTSSEIPNNYQQHYVYHPMGHPQFVNRYHPLMVPNYNTMNSPPFLVNPYEKQLNTATVEVTRPSTYSVPLSTQLIKPPVIHQGPIMEQSPLVASNSLSPTPTIHQTFNISQSNQHVVTPLQTQIVDPKVQCIILTDPNPAILKQPISIQHNKPTPHVVMIRIQKPLLTSTVNMMTISQKCPL